MKKYEKQFSALFLALAVTSVNAQNAPVQLKVDASEQIATVSKLFNGSNIEDLNNQTNGGMFSQLIHGEAFEESIDVDFLNLETKDYSKVYVVLDERGIPHLLTQADTYTRVTWNNLTEKYDFHSKDIYNANPFSYNPWVLSGWEFKSRFLPYDSLPANIRSVMLERVTGNEQISKYWNKQQAGDASYKYELVRDGNAYMGRQTQRISFLSGDGEVGITNHGLYKQGIRFDAGKSYDGILRIKAAAPTQVYLSLRDENGTIIAEKPYQVKGNAGYEKLEFELTPSKNTIKGCFGISLKSKGTIDLGFAFLQPGEWGRVEKGYPIRKMFTDALHKQGITAFRYNGSMVDVGADTYLYRWKKMIGPIDERRVTFRSGFNAYATHSFGFMEMLQAAESIDAVAIIGMSMDETYEDIRDFVEYVNGPVTSKWGALRATHGHPEPYNLRYIQVDNERPITRGYLVCMQKFAEAAWEVDPNMSIMTSLNIGRNGYVKGGSEIEKQRIEALEKRLADSNEILTDRERNDLSRQLASMKERQGEQYRLASELVGWFISKGKGDKLAWDPHYSGSRLFADDKEWFENEMGITLQRELAKDYPGYKLNLHPMEENGSRCDWDRGLAHASNWNTLQRYGDCFRMLGTANTFQPHGLHYMWDQGRVHYTADTIWFQPSAHIDEMMMKTWKPNVVATSSSDAALDITAKINDDKTEMTLYIANMSDQPVEGVLNIENFRFKSRVDVQTIGDCELTEFNTYDNKDNVVFKHSKANIAGKNAKYTFPKYSYTVFTLKK